MPGETNLHKTLKKEACHWLFKMGYRAIAAEVRLRPVGIIDAVGTGLFSPYHNYLSVGRAMPQGDILGFAPPLCLSRAEADAIIEATRKAVRQVGKASKCWAFVTS